MIQNFWLEISLYPGCVQGFFMAWLLWRKKESNKEAVRYFTALLLVISVLMLLRVTYQPAFLKKFAEIILLPDVVLFLTGPLIYLFTRALLRFDPLPQRQLFPHFIPAVVHVLVFNTFLGLHLNGTLHYLNMHQVFMAFNLIEAGSMLSLTIYITLSFQLFHRYKSIFYEKYAQPLAAEFLRFFLLTGYGLLVFWLAGFGVKVWRGRPDYAVYTIFWVMLVAAIYLLAYKIWVTPGVLEMPQVVQNEEDKTIEPVAETDIEMLRQFLKSEKPYLNPDLKIGDLADALQMPKHQLSKIINQGFDKNFFDLINGYRVQSFIESRNDPAFNHLNTLQLAYASGFNSKSAFNRAFLKETGKSPREYFG